LPDGVGIPADQLIGMAPLMPYWALEVMADYQQRLSQVLACKVAPRSMKPSSSVFLRRELYGLDFGITAGR
jgi:hypothetical protein